MKSLLVPAALLAAGFFASVSFASAPAAASATRSASPKAVPVAPAKRGVPQPLVRRHVQDGLAYHTGPQPAWVDDVEPVEPKSAPPGWHYTLRESQVRIGEGMQGYSRVIRHVTDPGGLSSAGQFAVSYVPEYQKVTFHGVTIIRAGQRIERLAPEIIKLLRREGGLEQGTYTGLVTASLVLSDVRVGDRIDLRLSIDGMNPVFQNRVAWFEGVLADRATGRYRARILHPAHRAIQVRLPGTPVQERPLGDGTVERVIARDHLEASSMTSAALSENMDKVLEVTEHTRWEDIADWGRRLFAFDRTANPEMVRKAGEIRAAAGDDPEARARAALDFVQRDIRYFAVLLGESSHRPNAPDVVLRNRYGDCKDKTILLIALLAEMGIAAHPQLVALWTQDQLAHLLPSPGLFDHVLAVADVGGRTYWLDGTRGLQRGPLSHRDVRDYMAGLPLQEGATLRKAAHRLPAFTETEFLDRFEVPALSQPVRLVSTATFRGAGAERIRAVTETTSAEEAADALFAWSKATFKSAGIEPDGAATLRESGDALVLQKAFRIPDLFAFQRDRTLQATMTAWAVATPLFPFADAARKHAAFLGTPMRMSHRIEVRFSEPVITESRSTREEVDGKIFKGTVARSQTAPSAFDLQVDVELSGERLEKDDVATVASRIRDFGNRLGMRSQVPALSPERHLALTRRLEPFSRGQTPEEFRAKRPSHSQFKVDAAVMTEILAEDRLNAKARAEVLRRRSVARDNLSESASALVDIEAAIKLDAKNDDLKVTGAIVLLGAARAADALAALDTVAPDTRDTPRFRTVRGRARFLVGDHRGALEDFKWRAERSTGQDRHYAALWLHAAAARAGEDAAAIIRSHLPEVTENAWPVPLVRFMANEIDEKTVLAAAANTDASVQAERLCETYFYLGLRKQLEGDAVAARRMFERARDTGVTEFVEWRSAVIELARS